jgi:hypothetical protein
VFRSCLDIYYLDVVFHSLHLARHYYVLNTILSVEMPNSKMCDAVVLCIAFIIFLVHKNPLSKRRERHFHAINGSALIDRHLPR